MHSNCHIPKRKLVWAAFPGIFPTRRLELPVASCLERTITPCINCRVLNFNQILTFKKLGFQQQLIYVLSIVSSMVDSWGFFCKLNVAKRLNVGLYKCWPALTKHLHDCGQITELTENKWKWQICNLRLERLLSHYIDIITEDSNLTNNDQAQFWYRSLSFNWNHQILQDCN